MKKKGESRSYVAYVTLTTSISIVAGSIQEAIEVAVDHVETQLPNATTIDGLMVTEVKEEPTK